MTNHPLTAFREERDLSRAQLGEKLGVTEVTVWRWETRKRAPRGAELERLCEFTGLSADELLRVSEPACGVAQ